MNILLSVGGGAVVVLLLWGLMELVAHVNGDTASETQLENEGVQPH